MSLQRFISEAISPWMKKDGPDSDIVLSSRIRLARNLQSFRFPLLATIEESKQLVEHVKHHLAESSYHTNRFELLCMDDMKPNVKRVLVEKHLISPHLAEESKHGAVMLSEDESISIMINEEDHLRIQCLFPGFQLSEALVLASGIDDWIEGKVDYAFDEKRGYLTSCPTNVGTGLRASVMMHLPALVMTQQINRILPAINQLGLVVRGIYGEGSEALGNLFQISNQMTLGKSEEDIVEDLRGVVMQLIQQERAARKRLLESSRLQLEDRVYRSYGILAHSRIIESKEATQKLSDVRLGIDLGLLKGVSGNILNELMILTQPGFLQQYAGTVLTADQRDERRAALIRARLKLEDESN
ncbi:protein arginine kinase [Halalkalibacterium halodurans]|uniref:Protein-arginine kinase n=1 Tax=Halalkalibacterium halodurans (strain ATCC BAA-125 / DSM 18197 / FERM 7344 / JCM 9153 / C-125) TaxID=272558 RepID=MCSB_HALH5|nr:protein arginine kinase [Halalkalibacterium halodurans]Q9KGG3.1 RecName: Full=Protein-arginine kinase [Halalkalibacterium halodurans C-125]MDY7220604.1 protein arginine kinase [Halalkalibacterium halodurans]MDY7239843.1 protein arginine kinase [Halalkalibacterium halodurans]MED3647638.1 protein arginine kinase [Halalkalibacterium halodurans]MED4081208.1 protein arginine kinase [Halalkalibacterium halodurans]MED4083923.1 protein arginine kinase [Halalkalibacterium halodurans]